jgi:DNA-nicking Smr family endonuclease
MRRKRKRDSASRDKEISAKDQTLFNRPFENVLKDLKDFDRRIEPTATAVSQPEKTIQGGDEEVFLRAMKDVVPLRDTRKKIMRSPVRKQESPDQQQPHAEKVREYLSDLVNNPPAWDISFSDEYMEGAVPGVGPKIMKRLKRGEISVQDYIDLHGLKKKEAETVVNDFVIKSYHKGLRCLLIVHGRGLGSVDNQPAIKKELPLWFRRGMLKRIVLAFVTARPCDGGAGALYVLLKKR